MIFKSDVCVFLLKIRLLSRWCLTDGTQEKETKVLQDF